MCVCVCVCVCVWYSTFLKLRISLERVAASHQKATESEIRTHIGNTIKIYPFFEEGCLKKKFPVEANAVETEPFVMWT